MRCKEGKKYGNWLVRKLTNKVKTYKTCSLYYCEAECLGCNKLFEVSENSLLYNQSSQCKSCGRTTHGKINSRAYQQWKIVKYSKNLKFCSRWEEFSNFYKDLGDCPRSFILCRKDQEGIFSPSNSYWGDPEGQICRRKKAYVTINNKSYSYRKLGALCGVSRTTIGNKLKRMTPEQLLSSYDVSLEEGFNECN